MDGRRKRRALRAAADCVTVTPTRQGKPSLSVVAFPVCVGASSDTHTYIYHEERVHFSVCPSGRFLGPGLYGHPSRGPKLGKTDVSVRGSFEKVVPVVSPTLPSAVRQRMHTM